MHLTRSALFSSGNPLRTMSTKLNHFVVWVHDQKDDQALARRMAVRTEHLSRIKSISDSGTFVFGGGLLDGQSVPDSPPYPLNGSMFVVKCESIQQATELMKNDPYYTGNVWDKERIEIRPLLVFDAPNYKP